MGRSLIPERRQVRIMRELTGRREIAGSTSTGALKVIALVFMFIDHAGKMLFPQVAEMRMLGRLAFPLYCWCAVVGVCCTRSCLKYLLRTLAVGLLSQPLYMIALDHTWTQPNIFLTLALGIAALWGIRERRAGSRVWAPLAALVLSVVLDANYGWRGVLLIILLYLARERKEAIAAVMIAFCLFWGSSSSVVRSFFGLELSVNWMGSLSALVTPWLRLQALAVFALPLMLRDLPWRWRMPKWLGYAIYPAHLALLWLLEQWI